MKSLFITILLFSAFTAFGCENPASNTNAAVPSPTPPANDNSKPVTIAESGPLHITFESADKTPIAGTFYPSPKPNSPAVLMLHQWMSDQHSYDDLALRMQAKGFGVLTIDGRGFGESAKTADGKTIAPSRSDDAVARMKADVGAALDLLAGQTNVDPARIGIVGASYGSSLALIHAAEDPRVKAAALLSPGLNYFGNMPTEPAVKKYGGRPLLLVAADDDAESAKSVRQLKVAGANDKYEVKIYPKGGHGTGLFGAKVGLEDLLIAFFEKNLRS
jgi:dienelactone hydrolase